MLQLQIFIQLYLVLKYFQLRKMYNYFEQINLLKEIVFMDRYVVSSHINFIITILFYIAKPIDYNKT